jgi:hypothetical protein
VRSRRQRVGEQAIDRVAAVLPGGRLIPCRTMSSGSAPGGRSSQFGDATCRAPATMPFFRSIRMACDCSAAAPAPAESVPS